MEEKNISDTGQQCHLYYKINLEGKKSRQLLKINQQPLWCLPSEWWLFFVSPDPGRISTSQECQPAKNKLQ